MTQHQESTLNKVVAQSKIWAKHWIESHPNDTARGYAATLPAVGLAPIEMIISSLGIDPGAYARPYFEEVLARRDRPHTLVPVLCAEYAYATGDMTHPVRVLEYATLHHPDFRRPLVETATRLQKPQQHGDVYTDIMQIRSNDHDLTTTFSTPHIHTQINGAYVQVKPLCATVESTIDVIDDTINIDLQVCPDRKDADAIVRAKFPQVTTATPPYIHITTTCAAFMLNDLDDVLRKNLDAHITHP